jgi:hypothetical protein
VVLPIKFGVNHHIEPTNDWYIFFNIIW